MDYIIKQIVHSVTQKNGSNSRWAAKRDDELGVLNPKPQLIDCDKNNGGLSWLQQLVMIKWASKLMISFIQVGESEHEWLTPPLSIKLFAPQIHVYPSAHSIYSS